SVVQVRCHITGSKKKRIKADAVFSQHLNIYTTEGAIFGISDNFEQINANKRYYIGYSKCLKFIYKAKEANKRLATQSSTTNADRIHKPNEKYYRYSRILEIVTASFNAIQLYSLTLTFSASEVSD
uniref:Uncharacterized protein n=1 Tax=Parascaris univalens TaxID=6257 RepID=A0A914ZLF0_PARUN